MKTYLYRAVNSVTVDYRWDIDSEPELVPAGELVFGRMSGYLSRSAAKAAGQSSGYPFMVVRSEPVVFLTAEESLERRISALQSELEAMRAGHLTAVNA